MPSKPRYELTVREGDTEQGLDFDTLKEAYEAVTAIATEAATKDSITFTTFKIKDRR